MTYAHVSTYRLGSSDEVARDVAYAADTEGAEITDQTARTIASWWHSPGAGSRNITALSHGRPFDTEELRAEISREVTDLSDAMPLLDWLDQLEAILEGAEVSA